MALKVERNVLLAQHTTLHVGGVADYFVVVKTEEELVEALQFAQQVAVSSLILGGGSNVLISDAGYRGLVIQNKIDGTIIEAKVDNVRVSVGAGVVLDELVADTVSKGYWGLENLSAIPGTVGATPIQNVGAYGVEVSSLITTVTAIHCETFTVKVFTNAECQFDYRDSFFKSPEGRQWVVMNVTFTLSKKPNAKLTYGALTALSEEANITPALVRAEVVRIRSTKFPDWNVVGTAGSFFKNPIVTKAKFESLQTEYPDIVGYEVAEESVKVSLGWVLDNVCHLRGYCENGLCLYEKQALVLVNMSAADAAAVDAFAQKIAAIVKEKTDIEIEREVRMV